MPSATFKAAAAAHNTTQRVHTGVVISHADITTLRFCDNTEDISRNGNTFTAFSFDAKLPDDMEDRMPNVILNFDNVDQQVMEAIRDIDPGDPPTVEIDLFLASSPDTSEKGPYVMTLRNTTTTAFQVSGQLGFEDVLNDPFPKDQFTPNKFPGLV